MPPPPVSTRTVPPRPVRWLFHLLAVASLALGILGMFLPVLPTTPFILLAAWAAARGSPRLLHWLETHRRFGPPLADWRRGGVVARKAKWLASALMAASVATMLVVLGPRWYVLAAIAVIATVLVWLWRRPEA